MWGRYDEALELYQRALAGGEKALGKGHLDTLTTVHDMAMVFVRQGRYNEALELYQRALAGKENVNGKDHPDTLATVNNIALAVFRIVQSGLQSRLQSVVRSVHPAKVAVPVRPVQKIARL
ncbi:hypothetical protein RUND412_004759 [Rhizina undulata]